jgi:hypothetical protein
MLLGERRVSVSARHERSRVGSCASIVQNPLARISFRPQVMNITSAMPRETWTMPRIHEGHNAKVYWNSNVCD